jgi:mono/diheme cytochrome c family protein
MIIRHVLGGLASVLWLGGCALQVQNTQPAQEHARALQPPGSVYAGWRVFQDKCAGCHGAAATGAGNGPDLLPRVREMGPQRFVGLVLNRYEWNLPAQEPGRDASAGRDALVEEIIQRRAGALMMPAWQGEPRVDAHVIDLYAYLTARAEGRQGPGRPAP